MALMKEQSQRNQMNGDRTGILPVLTEQELSILRVVLQKEEQEMKLLELRISEIRREIQELRKSGALTEGDNPDGQCARCKMKLSLLALPWRDSGGRCLACKFRVCSHCCVRQKNGSRICVLCCKYRQEKQLTGDWAAKETPGCLVGSDLLRCLLRNTGRVPPSHDDINGHKYTQRPAKVKDVDTESRTSKNSQSSTEDENLKKRSYRKEGSSERNGSQSKISMGSSGKSPNVQRRESYAEAVENQRTFAKNEKGNHHRSSSPSRHSTEEKNRNGRVCTDSSSVAADVISLSSSLKDSPRAARSSDISHRSTDSSYSSRRSLNREDSIFQVSRKSTNMPSALPSRYQFRRTSSVSTDNSQRSDKSLDSAPAQSNNLSGSKSKSTTDLSQIYPKKSILRSSDTNLAFQKKEPNKSYQRKTPSFFKLPSKKDKKSKSTESLKVVKIEESKSNVKRLMNFIKGDSNSPSRRSSVGVLFDSLKAQKELSSNSNMESFKDTDSGITSGTLSRTNTPEQRTSSSRTNVSEQRTSSSRTNISEQRSPSSRERTPEQKNPSSRPSSEHLKVPTIAVTQGESFLEEEDDLDDLFVGGRANQLLGSRSSLADSRESIYSVYSDAGEINYGRIPVTGEIMFHVAYDHKNSTLEVHIKQCKDLAAVDTKHNKSDPYVKTYLLPDKSRSSKRKTRIKKHTLNPVFDEVLKYPIASSELESRTLWLSVWHNDRFGRNDFLGEVNLPMDYYRLDQSSPMWYPLQERVATQEAELSYNGDLFIALKYVTPDMVDVTPKKKSGSLLRNQKDKVKAQPDRGEIQVLVREARNLTAVRGASGSNPFCKGYLLPQVAHPSKQKTPVIKKTTNPQWQHILVFEGVAQPLLPDSGLELTVWDHEAMSSNDFLGGVRLNLGRDSAQDQREDWMDARGEEIDVWQTMIDHPNEWVDAQLPLRPSMGKRTVKK